MSDIDFKEYILFLGGVSTTVREDESIDIFDLSNIKSSALSKLKEGLKNEAKEKTYINDSDITDAKIDDFLKDENNKCDFDGIVGDIKCTSFKMEQCHINDEFATINSGLIDVIDFNHSSKIDISYCTVSSNTLNHAFFGSTKSWSYTGDFGGFDDSNIVATDNDCLTNISYCSNFGDSQYLIDCFAGSQKY